MAVPGIPQNFVAQTGNQQILLTWDLVAGANAYRLQRSSDNITFATIVTLTGNPLATSYVDTAVTLGTQYWYQVAASSDGGSTFSLYTNSQSEIATPQGEVSLKWIRDSAKERSDRVESDFVTDKEWNKYINQALYELYDLIVTTYEDYHVGNPIQFSVNGTQFLFPLPNGSNTFINPIDNTTFTPPAMYKLLGVDLAVQNNQQGYVTVDKFNFIDRNSFVYPNTASTLYGVFNIRYRQMGNNLMFIPTPSAGQNIRLWYVPRLKTLLLDTDTTSDMSISGWIEYVVVRAAKYALDKEEQDTTHLKEELIYLKGRIEEAASNRDAGQPDTISNTRGRNGWGPGEGGPGFDGRQGGF